MKEELLDCISDLRLYLHQRYGLPLKDPRVLVVPPLKVTPTKFAGDSPRSVAGDSSSSSSSSRDLSPGCGTGESAASLDDLRRILGDCRRCGLCSGRTNIVFGDGPASSEMIIVGEAPGAEEDAQGLPFVGRSGQILSKILLALGLDRKQVYITNVVKCRPPQNRNPKPEEVSACSPFLLEQIRLVKPKLILALGTFAAQTLLATNEPIMRLRGKSYTYAGLPLIVTLHPAACLYNPGNKKYLWDDVKGIPDMLRATPN